MTAPAPAPAPSPPAAPPDLAGDLLESDRLYFELGASVMEVPAASLAWVEGMESVAGAGVVQRVRSGEAGADPAGWAHELVQALSAVGLHTARVYFDDAAPALESALAAAGFRRRVEIGYLACGTLEPRPGRHPVEITLREINTSAGWDDKHELHASSHVASDGHATPAAEWVELERRKCETGAMRCYLIEAGGEVCGSIATLVSGDVLRAKNVFVHPDRRRQGIAAGAMRVVSRWAQEHGKAATGIFGVEGNAGNSVYVHLALTPAVRQYEWSMALRPRTAAL